MISKNPQSTSALKPQSDRDLAAAGGDLSCDGSWLFPELCVLGHGHDNLRRPNHPMSERLRHCMSSSSSSIEKISDTNGGNDKADGGEPPTTGDQNVDLFGNNYGFVVPPPPPAGIIIHDGEEEEEVGGGGCGINEEGGTVAGRKKRTWTAEEDEKLKRAVEEHGSGNWMIIERCSGLGRTSKSCRLRWTNHLRPNLKKGSFSESEERTVVMLHQKYGNKWSFIASKLPGRTDNEVKNFWHGRLRRCRKQYLDIYPPAHADGNNILVSNQKNQNGSTVSKTGYDYTNHINISSHFSTSTINDHHPNQSQLLLQINQLPVTSSSHHHASLPMINTAQSHHQLHSNIILHQTEPPPPPPPPLPFSKFSSTEQGSISSSGLSSSSISSHKLQSSPELLASSHQVSSQFNSNTTRGSPTESACQQQFLSSRPTNNSPLELKVTTPQQPPYHSYLQVNPSSATSSSPVRISPKLEIPVTSPAIESLTEVWLNSTIELAKPCSPDFELPQSQSSPSYFNRNSSAISNFTPNTELPSFQIPENASLLQVQEPHAKTDLLYPISSEKDNPDKSLDNKIPSAEIFFKNGKTTDNEGTFSNPTKRKESFGCEGWEAINSSGSHVVKKNLQSRNRMAVDKRLKTEILRGKISRREGLLAEISKTGVLLVEKEKKERLISKLLNQSAKQDIVLSQSPNSNTENLQSGEISKIKDFLSDSLSIEDILTDICNLRDEKSEDDAFMDVNSILLEENHQNLQDTLLDKSSSESVLLRSYEQDDMHDLDVLGIGTQIYGTNLFKPPVGGICNDELNSVQVFHEISGRDALPCSGQEREQEKPSMNQLESGGYVGVYETDCLRTETSENSKKEFSEQFQWAGQDDPNLILYDYNWGDGRYIFGNMQTPVHPDILESSCGILASSSAGLVMEDGQRNEISSSRKGSEESSRKRYPGESSIERVHGFQELTLNDFLPVTTTTHQNTTTYDMPGSDAQCSSKGMTIEEDDGHRNIQPEELSSLLEFLPTILPEWNNFSHNTSTSK